MGLFHKFWSLPLPCLAFKIRDSLYFCMARKKKKLNNNVGQKIVCLRPLISDRQKNHREGITIWKIITIKAWTITDYFILIIRFLLLLSITKDFQKSHYAFKVSECVCVGQVPPLEPPQFDRYGDFVITRTIVISA